MIDANVEDFEVLQLRKGVDVADLTGGRSSSPREVGSQVPRSYPIEGWV